MHEGTTEFGDLAHKFTQSSAEDWCTFSNTNTFERQGGADERYGMEVQWRGPTLSISPLTSVQHAAPALESLSTSSPGHTFISLLAKPVTKQRLIHTNLLAHNAALGRRFLRAALTSLAAPLLPLIATFAAPLRAFVSSLTASPASCNRSSGFSSRSCKRGERLAVLEHELQRGEFLRAFSAKRMSVRFFFRFVWQSVACGFTNSGNEILF